MKQSMIFMLALFCALFHTPSFAQNNNVQTLKGFFSAVDGGNFDKAVTFLSDDVKAYLPLAPQPLDKTGYQQLGMGFKAAFPDMQHQFLETSESGNTVACKGLFTGTNTGPMMGNPPAGNHVETPFLGYFKFDQAGRISEVNIQFDLGGFNQQVMAGVPSVQEMNKKSALQVMDALNRHDLSAAASVYAPGCRFNGWAPEPLDINGYKQAMSALLASFPDGRFVVDDVLAEGDKVIVRHHFTGTHTGAPFQSTPASNRKVSVPATVTIQIEDGKSVELWLNADFLGLMMQIGAIPAEGQGK